MIRGCMAELPFFVVGFDHFYALCDKNLSDLFSIMSDFQLKRKKLVSQLNLTAVEFQFHTFGTTKWINLYIEQFKLLFGVIGRYPNHTRQFCFIKSMAVHARLLQKTKFIELSDNQKLNSLFLFFFLNIPFRFTSDNFFF